MGMTEEYMAEFLQRPLVAVISTMDSEGLPRSAPIWFGWKEGAAYMFTGRRTLNPNPPKV